MLPKAKYYRFLFLPVMVSASDGGPSHIEMVIAALIPIVALAIAIHCCLKYWQLKKDRRQDILLTVDDKMFWAGESTTVRRPLYDRSPDRSPRCQNAIRGDLQIMVAGSGFDPDRSPRCKSAKMHVCNIDVK